MYTSSHKNSMQLIFNKKRETICINEAKQNILTVTKNESNPVILFLYGGPGAPDRPFIEKYNIVLADCYTLVCWDQRGCGLSYSKEPLSVSVFLDDLDCLIEYLCNRYNRDKIILAGHSWGAYLGLRYTHLHPEKITAYIGTGQGISSLDEAEKYRFCMQTFRCQSRTGDVRQ